MPLDNVDENRFDNEDAVLAAGMGFVPSPQSPDFLQVLSEVASGKRWEDILLRCLRSEVAHIRVWVGRTSDHPSKLNVDVLTVPAEGGLALLEQFEATLPTGGKGKIVEEGREFEDVDDDEPSEPEAKLYGFDIGPEVVKTVAKLKEIDATRGEPAPNPDYSLRDISKMAVSKSLERQWVLHDPAMTHGATTG